MSRWRGRHDGIKHSTRAMLSFTAMWRYYPDFLSKSDSGTYL